MALLDRHPCFTAFESKRQWSKICGPVNNSHSAPVSAAVMLLLFLRLTVDAYPRWGESFAFYRDVPSILYAAKSLATPILLATASRTHAPDLANTLLKQLIVKHSNRRAIEYFDYMQIFPGDKKQHFSKINKASGVAYEEMLFFDDEVRNRNVESLGVVMCLVRDGVTRSEVDRGIREWRKRNGREEREESEP